MDLRNSAKIHVMKIFYTVAAVFVLAVSMDAQTCVDSAKQIKTVLSEAAAKTYETNLAAAREAHAKNPNDADAIIWLGRRIAYTGEYKEAIKIFSQGIVKFPNDARLYRHRGHRYITLRCFDDAIRDFEIAVTLIKGKPDEVEPDGLPNAKNIPTSTLHTNIWYHLGLAYYLKGDFKRALKAYEECLKASKNNDMLAAAVHWQYMTLRRLGREKEARSLLKPFDSSFQVIENDDYLKLIRLYRGDTDRDTFIKNFGERADTLGNASLGYGWGNWNLYNREPEDAKRIFGFVTEGNQWASFGFIAAEIELKRYD